MEKHDSTLTEASGKQVAVVGDVFVDIIACVRDLSLHQRNLDVESAIEPQPGGSALNTASHLASLSRKTGWSVSLHGGTGNDMWEDLVKQHCLKCGLVLCNKRFENAATSVCIAVTDSQKQTFISHRGATGLYGPNDLNMDKLIESDHVHLGGIKSTLNLQHALPSIIEDIKRHNPMVTFSLNTNGGYRGDWCRSLLSHVDLFIQNEDEAMSISGTKTTLEALKWLSMKVKAIVVITLGEKGAICYDVKSRKTVEVSGVCISPRDTTGCGDAFIATFLFEWLRGTELVQTMIYATKASASAALTVGACSVLLESAASCFPQIKLDVKVSNDQDERL
mmetsp:Transcript_17296/g.20962  ORF Transcript_17296/g.20962 Transcript_17296/m.20962 type:complete len:336 (+) Transcript_17296:20-1027(+)